MVQGLQGHSAIRIRDLYPGVLGNVMNAYNIQSLAGAPDHVVRADASFEEVVQHTDWFCWRRDSRPHYRYRRYREVLGHVPLSGHRVAHVDIGCGAGLFAWAFLDWARDFNLPFHLVDLYGLDHSPMMIYLAHEMRRCLTPIVIDYPNSLYTYSIDTLRRVLEEGHRPGIDYIITLGHVLAQVVETQNTDAIPAFTQVIRHIVGLPDNQSNYILIAVDAQNWSAGLAQGWTGLLDGLATYNIGHQEIAINATPINDGNRAKIARLLPAGR